MTNTKTTSTKTILKSLRDAGLSAKSQWPKIDTPAAEWPICLLLGGRVLNVCVSSILGFGCIDDPLYSSTQNELCQKVEKALTVAGVTFYKSLPDQYVVSR